MKKITPSPLQRPVAVLSGILLSTLLASGAALAATGSTPAASVIARNQKLKSDSVSITYAFLPKDGSLDIYSVGSSGSMSKSPIGTVSLKAGDHRDVNVSLKPAPKQGERLEAVVEQSNHPVKNSGNQPERSFKIL